MNHTRVKTKKTFKKLHGWPKSDKDQDDRPDGAIYFFSGTRKNQVRMGSLQLSHILVTKRRRLHLRNEERAGLTRRATETDAGGLSEYVEEVEGSATQSGWMIPALQ